MSLAVEAGWFSPGSGPHLTFPSSSDLCIVSPLLCLVLRHIDPDEVESTQCLYMLVLGVEMRMDKSDTALDGGNGMCLAKGGG